MQVTKKGSVRVDLVGGTLDLEPINLILPNVVTLNVATSLKAEVSLFELQESKIIIISEDYHKSYEYSLIDMTDKNLYYSDFYQEMSFVMQIISLFNKEKGLKVSLKSGAPAGSGLGGSSAMGITLYRALSEFYQQEVSVTKAVEQVKGIEGRILNKGMPGYQDYFPAILGGILALRGEPGKINHEQLYSEELKEVLEENLTLVYSGISRNSGINNWDVYKGFFDGNREIKNSLKEIAKISFDAYKAINDKDWDKLFNLIGVEGELRKSLATGIVPDKVNTVYTELYNSKLVSGMKMCGAGGGGCFILINKKNTKDKITKILSENDMRVLEFSIDMPIKGS